MRFRVNIRGTGTQSLFRDGEVVELISDDGTICPTFRSITTGKEHFCSWFKLEPELANPCREVSLDDLYGGDPYITAPDQEDETLPPEVHNDTPIDGGRALDIINEMFRGR